MIGALSGCIYDKDGIYSKNADNVSAIEGEWECVAEGDKKCSLEIVKEEGRNIYHAIFRDEKVLENYRGIYFQRIPQPPGSYVMSISIPKLSPHRSLFLVKLRPNMLEIRLSEATEGVLDGIVKASQAEEVRAFFAEQAKAAFRGIAFTRIGWAIRDSKVPNVQHGLEELTQKKYREAFRSFMYLSDRGNMEAQFFAAMLYFRFRDHMTAGLGAVYSPMDFLELLVSAYSKGHPRAAYELAQILERIGSVRHLDWLAAQALLNNSYTERSNQALQRAIAKHCAEPAHQGANCQSSVSDKLKASAIRDREIYENNDNHAFNRIYSAYLDEERAKARAELDNLSPRSESGLKAIRDTHTAAVDRLMRNHDRKLLNHKNRSIDPNVERRLAQFDLALP